MKKIIPILFIAFLTSCGSSKSMTDISNKIDDTVNPPVNPGIPENPSDDEAVTKFKTIVAVIDSGVDLDHKDLAGRIYSNDIETSGVQGVDDDQNGFVDDFHGWNFVDDDNLVFDPAFRNRLTDNVAMFSKYDLASQNNEYLGTPMPLDLDNWYSDLVKDPMLHNDVLSEYDNWGGYAHGTHVAGIVLKSLNNVVLPIKYLSSYNFVRTKFYDEAVAEIQNGVKVDRESNELLFSTVSKMGGRVVNASYGYDFEMSKDYFVQYFSDDEATELAKLEINSLNDATKKIMEQYPHILFVVAAGNNNSDNDAFPDNPSGASAQNKISVGASFESLKIASFSNYGKTTVDVFAPGVNIVSTVPENNGISQLAFSGTSQAAPFVAKIAGQIIAMNPFIDSAIVKRIILETVDFKPFLADKCKTSGIVNEARAIKASELYRDGLKIDEAINEARTKIKDVRTAMRFRKSFSLLRDEYNDDLDHDVHVLKRPSHIVKFNN